MKWVEAKISKSRAARERGSSIFSKVRRAWQLRESRADWQRLKVKIEDLRAGGS